MRVETCKVKTTIFFNIEFLIVFSLLKFQKEIFFDFFTHVNIDEGTQAIFKLHSNYYFHYGFAKFINKKIKVKK